MVQEEDYNWLDEAKDEEQELDEEMTQDLKLLVETEQEKKKKEMERTGLCLPDHSPLQNLNYHPKFWNRIILLLLSEVSLIQLQQYVSQLL